MDINNTTMIKDPIAGNGIAASHDIGTNDVIIQIASPYLLVVEKEALEKVCSFCLIEASAVEEPLKRCGACKVPWYCSSDCQKKDWKSAHQKECQSLKSLPNIPPTPVRALMQVLLRHRHGVSLDPRWAGLESHVEDLRKDRVRWGEIILQAKAAVEFSKSQQDRMDVAIQVICRMIINAFRATLADDTPVGLCFEPTLALANHSCSPNAVVVFDGRSVALRALNPVGKGEQIFISYITATDDLYSRQSDLMQRYFFECVCEKCCKDESPYSMFLRYAPKRKGRIDMLCNSEYLVVNARNLLATYDTRKIAEGTLVHLHKANNYPELGQSPNVDPTTKGRLLKQGANACAPEKKLFALHPFPKILHELYLNYLDTASYVNALVVLLFLFLNCDVYNYPQPHHPVRVIRLFTIAKLLKHLSSFSIEELQLLAGDVNGLGRVIKGIDLINSFHAVMILVWEQGARSHGKESRFMREVEVELRDVDEVQRLRGEPGTRLRKWIGDAGSTNGMKEARRIFEGLRSLSECVLEILTT